MEKSKRAFGQSESCDFFPENSGNISIFQDPYAKYNERLEEREPIANVNLTELMQSIHELNSHAEKLLNNKEYDRALPFLLESYKRLTEFQHSPQSDEVTPIREYMYWLAWVCYRISFCYCRAEDYVHGYYYIQLVSGVNSECFMEWINVLVNSRRMDALGKVETYLQDPEMLDPICNDEAEKKKVLDFLERRLCFLFIEYGKLEKAREIFAQRCYL